MDDTGTHLIVTAHLSGQEKTHALLHVFDDCIF